MNVHIDWEEKLVTVIHDKRDYHKDQPIELTIRDSNGVKERLHMSEVETRGLIYTLEKALRDLKA